jgi:cation diffusion facilitator CzcD-associated flavoprotein CzcO
MMDISVEQNPKSESAGRSGIRYAVIGAGSSGLCAAKYLTQAGFTDVTIFEIGSKIGGLWCYQNDSGMSSAYRTLHINTPKAVTNFRDYRFREDVQMFPDIYDMHEYFTSYAEHFDLVKLVRFNSRVVSVKPAEHYTEHSPKWDLTTEDGRTEGFDRIIVASGHLSYPNHVEYYQKAFTGDYMHAHDYREPDPFVGKRVCIVGAGNSACDIASDVCVTGARTTLVARSGVVIAPKTVCGIPYHDIELWLQRRWWAPTWFRRNVKSAIVHLIHGRMTKLGFKPLLKKVHGTSNAVLVQHIQYRRVEVKQGIEKIEGRTIAFADGTSAEYDTLVAATGYSIKFPFFASDVIDVKDNAIDLYKRIVPPDWRGLYFVGLINVGGSSAIFTQESQMKWILPFEEGDAVLPPKTAMLEDIEKKKRHVAATYSSSRRHTIEESQPHYDVELGSTLKSLRSQAPIKR